MPSFIRFLDDLTINQIAAGEVIENPASIVKELVDNSLDAHATSLHIEIKGGGKQFIRVSDNGIGMTKEDAILCFERYATSKVSKIEDLENLVTMGFRGEALASIASIAKVRMKTRSRDEKEGTFVEISGGKCSLCSSIPCDTGTSMDIEDLFFNVPARKKFLKSPNQNLQEIHKGLIALSLANPAIDFEFLSEGTSLLKTQKNSLHAFQTALQTRVQEVLHPELHESLQPIAYETTELKIEGFIGTPFLHRPHRTGQYLFINRRPIKSWLIAQAVLEGYGTALPVGRFPVFILHLTMPSFDLDVNVHPQKKEVKFRQEMQLKQLIKEAISSCFQPTIAPAMDKEVWQLPKIPYFPPSPFALQESNSNESFFAKDNSVPTVIGTVLNYIILETSPLVKETAGGFCLVDYKRAQNRILYEQLIKKNHDPTHQVLLIHFTVELSTLENQLVLKHRDKIESMGFALRPFGPSTWIIEAIPSSMTEEEAKDLLQRLLKVMEEFNPKEWQEEQAHQIARALVERIKKESIRLPVDIAQIFLKQLLKCQQPYFSPSGEPIFVSLSDQDLMRLF